MPLFLECTALGYTLGTMEKAQKVSTMKLGMVGPFDFNWPNDDQREFMVEEFCQQLGLARRDVRDIQVMSYGKLGKQSLIELRNESTAQWTFSKYFFQDGITVQDPNGQPHRLWLQPKDPLITMDRRKLQRSVVAFV